MTDAFRDDLDAARVRVDQLEEENSDMQARLDALAEEEGESDAKKAAVLLSEANARTKRVERDNERLRVENDELLGTVTELRKDLERKEPQAAPAALDRFKTVILPILDRQKQRVVLAAVFGIAMGVAAIVAKLLLE